MAMGTMALAAMLVSAGTFALFTDDATNAGNTFTAGSVVIDDVTGGTAFSTSVLVGNLAPGDTESTTVTIKNNGTLDAWVQIDAANSVGTGALFVGAAPLAVTLDSDVVLIPAGGQAAFDVSYNFPLAADNSYEGATGTIDIAFQAVQARNNTNGTSTGPNNW